MSRATLPVAGVAIVDAENNATVQFNSWAQGVDAAVLDGGLSVGARQPLPPQAIVGAQRPTIPFLKWLLWVDGSILPLHGKRQPLPKDGGIPIVGIDRNPTIPFFSWCKYVDNTLG